MIPPFTEFMRQLYARLTHNKSIQTDATEPKMKQTIIICLLKFSSCFFIFQRRCTSDFPETPIKIGYAVVTR